MVEQPDRYYRVSVKALVFDGKGRILVCKEDRPHWSLPGGGIDHGEQPLHTLARELKEELGITNIVSAVPSSAHTFFVTEKDAWFMWLVYEVTLANYDFTARDLVEEAVFMEPEHFAGSDLRAYKLVHAVWLAATTK